MFWGNFTTLLCGIGAGVDGDKNHSAELQKWLNKTKLSTKNVNYYFSY